MEGCPDCGRDTVVIADPDADPEDPENVVCDWCGWRP